MTIQIANKRRNTDIITIDAETLTGMDLRKYDLRECDLSNQSLAGCNMEGMDLTGCIFYNTNLSGANLSRVNLSDASFNNVSAYNTNFAHAIMQNVHICKGDFERSMFDRSDLSWANIEQSNFESSMMVGISANIVVIKDSNFSDVTISHSSLVCSKILSTNCEYADISFSDCRGMVIQDSNLYCVQFDNSDLGDALILCRESDEISFSGASIAEASIFTE